MVNYKELGFRCGLEIHQQLETHKLFCDCPSLVNDDNPIDVTLTRQLRSAAGETGKVDMAAAFEKKKGKLMHYEACSTSSCLVEYDEEPPKQVNEDALEVALQVALLLNAHIIEEIQVMRKTIVDGSNVSGFQRTMLIAIDGYIETSKGRVGVESVCLEEESAKKVKQDAKSVTYRLDRLGIPLVEIATDASIQDAEHAKEVAGILGMIVRSTNKVKRGIGSIRQDVNVSIRGHPRVEVKGFQELRYIPKIIDYEIKRQLQAMKGKKELVGHVRKANPNGTTEFLRPMPGADRLYPETDVRPIAITKAMIKQVKVPELISEKSAAFEKKYGLSPALAREAMEHCYFEQYAKQFQLDPVLIAKVLIEIPKELKKRFNIDPAKLKQDDFMFVLEQLNKDAVPKEAALEILSLKAQGKKVSLADFKKADDTKVKQEIEKIVKANPGAPFNALMGLVMKKFRGKCDGKMAAETIKKLVK